MKKLPKTSLFNSLRMALQVALKANEQGCSAQEIMDQAKNELVSKKIDRRRFLENSGKSILAGGMAGMASGLGLNSLLEDRRHPNIAIIGGGIAGLAALHTLRKAGIKATIYEASGRTGGRMFTVQKAMGEGTWTEFGGEFIDTNHKDMWDLAKEFDLELIDYGQPSQDKFIKETFFFEGKHRTMAEAAEAFRGFAGQIKTDAEKLPKDLSYKTKDPDIIRLDRMSLSEYLEKIGATGWIKKMIESAYEPEYGLSCDHQSAINLIILIATDSPPGDIELFGTSDERYKIRGGNQSIPDALSKKYANHIETNQILESIHQRGNKYELHFSGMFTSVRADYIILTLPFTKLREVDFKIKMSTVKRNCIDQLGYGTNAKLMLGMKSHHWNNQGFQGLCYSDNGIPNGWDNAQLQTLTDQTAGLSILFGGKQGIDLGNRTVESQKEIYLPKWNEIYPGAIDNFNGKLARMHWPSYKFNKCSYICYTPGQYTSISGAEVEKINNIYFAGEHCGGEFAGFMNGAAKSGREAAEAFVKKTMVNG